MSFGDAEFGGDNIEAQMATMHGENVNDALVQQQQDVVDQVGVTATDGDMNSEGGGGSDSEGVIDKIFGEGALDLALSLGSEQKGETVGVKEDASSKRHRDEIPPDKEGIMDVEEDPPGRETVRGEPKKPKLGSISESEENSNGVDSHSSGKDVAPDIPLNSDSDGGSQGEINSS